jgi:hypothetical protein
MTKKMNKVFDICFLIYIVWTLTVFVLDFKGYIAFGHGMGDIFDLIIIFLVAIFLSIIYIKGIRKLKKTLWGLIFMGVLLVDVIVVILMHTIFRGPEFPWNGTLFLD